MIFTDTIEQGADYRLALFDVQPGGAATDLTGCTARLQARRTVTTASPAVELTSSANGGLTITGPAGRIDVHVPNSTTGSMSGTYVVQLEITWPNGVIERFLDGVWTVSPEVVR